MMETSFLDLRYKTNEVLKALLRCEEVYVTYRNKLVGTIIPTKTASTQKVQDHKFFGMLNDDVSVDETMQALRGSRYDF